MRIVYADVLIAINFSMDFVALYITAKILSAKIYTHRILISAIIGSFYSLTDFLIKWPVPFLSVLVNIIVSYLMCLIAYRSDYKRNLIHTFIFYGICFLFGGAITGIYSVCGSKWDLLADTGYIYADISIMQILVISAFSFVVSYILSQILKKRQITAKSAEIEITINNKTISGNAYCDSGCLAKEPITNKDVVFIKKSLINEFIGDNDILSQKVCFVPIKTLAGRDVIMGIFPKKLKVNGFDCDAVVAFADDSLLSFGKFDVIVPSSLV